MTAPTDAITDLIWDVAERVVRPRWRSLDDSEVREKAPGDLVTVADHQAEAELTAALQQMAPGVLVVGEEATAADASLLEQLCDTEHAFVVDPVDGTKNFVEGREQYALMVGEVRHGRPVRGWIVQPELDRTFVAERGAGLLCNGERVRREAPALGALRGATSHRRLLGDPVPGVVDPLDFTFYSCGIDYPHVATGGWDFLIYRNLKPWDHVPGTLMVEEVGGHVATTDGQPYVAGSPMVGQLIAAASKEAWDLAYQVLADPAQV
ncbi:inositol monophosphatase family protein [Mariniluteicoccus endophyticus]